MAREIFRKVSLARLASPEQLDQLVKITTPRAWIALLAILALIGATAAWAFTGKVATRVSGAGVLLKGDQAGQKLELVLYLPLREGKLVAPGMEVLASPVNMKKESYGYLSGKVRGVTEYASSREELMHTLKNESMVTMLTRGEPVLEARVDLSDDVGVHGSRLSEKVGTVVKLTPGTPCSGLITIEERRPISMVIPLIK